MTPQQLMILHMMMNQAPGAQPAPGSPNPLLMNALIAQHMGGAPGIGAPGIGGIGAPGIGGMGAPGIGGIGGQQPPGGINPMLWQFLLQHYGGGIGQGGGMGAQ